MSTDSPRFDRSDVESATRETLADLTTTLAGTLLLIAASFDVLQALTAIFDDDLFTGGNDYLFDTTTWGWVNLVVGVLAGVIAIGILLRAAVGQVAGLVVAAFVMLTNFAFMPYYPFWSITIIAFSGLVIWALCTQLKRDR